MGTCHVPGQGLATRLEFYAPERDTNSRERLALAAELALAIESGAIEVYFQPEADARSRRIEGDCDLIQGCLLSRPLPAAELEPQLRSVAARATPA